MSGGEVAAWPDALFDVLVARDVRQVAYVPDAGHSRLIECCEAHPDMTATVLTTEEEGVALLAGAWLGGDRGVLLMQSSGVGNCVNMFTLIENCRMPLVALVTMRGEWGEFNPWQEPMGRATPDVLARMNLQVHRADTPEDAAPMLDAAIRQSFDGFSASAVLLSQRLIGRKAFEAER
ncbi:MAG: phosphonopyruvate decarboxylase [Alphaproteobacteria bacterium]|nr:phosphonopyruvate decarboxylase [Alphaproteobacteria bacterium]